MSNSLSFETLVNTRTNELTETELLICKHIQENREEFVRSSISKAAATMSVGEASIIRFSRKLGFTGLTQLKRKLRDELENGVVELQALSSISEKTTSFLDIASQLARNTEVSIKQTASLVTEEQLNQVASWLNHSEHVYFYGIGMSAVSALGAKYRFMRIRQNTDALIDNHTLLLNSNNISENDVIIAITHSGESKDIINAVRTAKKNGAKVIIISKFAQSKVSEYADIILLTGGTSNQYESDSSTIIASQMYIIDLLFHSMIYVNKGKSMSKMIEVLETINSD